MPKFANHSAAAGTLANCWDSTAVSRRSLERIRSDTSNSLQMFFMDLVATVNDFLYARMRRVVVTETWWYEKASMR